MEEKSLDPRIAECVGLWLAEGDNKSKQEITFTNNCWELVDLFYMTISQLFPNLNPRIYVYSKTKGELKFSYKNCHIRYYIHKRATKPFFILRFASVEKVKIWRKIVLNYLKNSENYKFILRGFFAGEGNVYMGKHKSRRLRISQKIQKDFINNLLNHFNLKFSFEQRSRDYVMTGKSHWDIFAKFNLADLHPNKKEKFWEIYNSFQQEHYPRNFLINEVFSILDKPLTTRELSKKFNRSFARMQDVLIDLKKQEKIFNFRIRSFNYWTRDKKIIMISKLKKEYLSLLGKLNYTSEFAKHFKVCWKSSFKRLKELEKLELTRRKNNGTWIKRPTKKNIQVI